MDVVERWTGRLAVALQSALRLTNEQFAADLGCATRTVAKWHERPELVLRPAGQQDLDCLLGRVSPEAQERFAMLATAQPLPVSGTPRDGGMAGSRDELMEAACESSADASLRAGHLGADVLPDLVQHVMQVARDYDTEARMAAFQHARAIRDMALSLTTTTRRPTELADLYVSAGQSTALMASLAFDLGRWDAAAPIARAATAYASLSGHPSLIAWSLGFEATLAFWREEADAALDRVGAGLELAPAGEPRIRLLHIEARAHAVRGDVAGVQHSLELARAELDSTDQHDELHHGVGGEFRFDEARANACAGAAWLRVGDADRAAASVRFTIALAEAGVTSPAPGVLDGARIDLAAALVLGARLDEAEAELGPVLHRGNELGSVSLGSRLDGVRARLAAAPWSGDRAAQGLAEMISDRLRSLPAQRGK